MPWDEDDLWEEYNVMHLMVQKYYDMIQLFMDSDKLDAVEQGYMGLQYVQEVLNLAQIYYSLDVSTLSDDPWMQKKLN